MLKLIALTVASMTGALTSELEPELAPVGSSSMDGDARELHEHVQLHAHQLLLVGLMPGANVTHGIFGTTTWRYGGTSFVGLPVWYHQIELEVAIGGYGDGHSVLVPIDFLLKKPIQLTPNWRLLFGVGPGVNIEQAEGGHWVNLGATVTLNLQWWLRSDLSVAVQADYTGVFAHAYGSEVSLNIGVVYAVAAPVRIDT